MRLPLRIAVAGMLIPLLFGACSSSPPSRFYTLSALDADTVTTGETGRLLGLGPFRMPEYLNRSQIVTRGDDAAMLIDEFVRWSEPLALALPRIVATNVDNLLADTGVAVFPFEPIIRDQLDYRLVGDIKRFDADQRGQVVLDVQWTVSDQGGGIVVALQRGRYQAQAADAADPGAVIAAMNETLASFSREVAVRLESLP